MYGKELILDLHECDVRNFNRIYLEMFFKSMCQLIYMTRADLHFWDYKGHEKEREVDPDHLVGTSAIQFIETSNITIHCLDKLGKVFINIFSCKDFDVDRAAQYTSVFFGGKIKKQTIVERI